MLHLSHIMLRYAELDGNLVGLSPAQWFVDYPETHRSATQAYETAESLAARATSGEAFRDLARRFSEDPVTRRNGGSLGAQQASQFLLWPQVLDAIAHTPIGGVTRPVWTPSGVHIFYRRKPPSDRTISGRRIVIGHRNAPWLRFSARGALVQRTRDEALARANQLAKEIARAPSSFEMVVHQASEHLDAMRGGDLGTWSNQEPSLLWRELEVLDKLEVGEVSEPVEGPLGIQLLQRTAPRARVAYATTSLQLFFDPAAKPHDEYSSASIRNRARALAKELHSAPSLLSHYQSQYCCSGSTLHLEGRGWPSVEQAVLQLAPGDITPEPVLADANRYVILQRLKDVPEPPQFSLELPDPKKPNIRYFALEDPELTRSVLATIRRKLVARFSQFEELFPAAATEASQPNNTDPRISDNLLAQIEHLEAQVTEHLGAAGRTAYEELILAELEHMLLQP